MGTLLQLGMLQIMRPCDVSRTALFCKKSGYSNKRAVTLASRNLRREQTATMCITLHTWTQSNGRCAVFMYRLQQERSVDELWYPAQAWRPVVRVPTIVSRWIVSSSSCTTAYLE